MTRLTRIIHWANSGCTIATLSFDFDTALKIAVFAFVTIPLGYVQWVSAVEKWKERRAKRNV